MALRVFIDESGDLGFTPKSSRVFVVAYVVMKEPYAIATMMTRLRKSMNERWKGYIHEFKFSQDSDVVKRRVFSRALAAEFDLGLVVIDKSSAKRELRGDPSRMYRFVVVNYVVTSIVQAYEFDSICFTIDKSLSKDAKQYFDAYLQNKLSWRKVMEKGEEMPVLEVKHIASHYEPCIQLADYCSGSAFRKFEFGNPEYYDLVKAKIKFRDSWGNIAW